MSWLECQKFARSIQTSNKRVIKTYTKVGPGWVSDTWQRTHYAEGAQDSAIPLCYILFYLTLVFAPGDRWRKLVCKCAVSFAEECPDIFFMRLCEQKIPLFLFHFEFLVWNTSQPRAPTTERLQIQKAEFLPLPGHSVQEAVSSFVLGIQIDLQHSENLSEFPKRMFLSNADVVLCIK